MGDAITSTASIYQPLSPAKKEIRLLELLPPPPDDQIFASCRLSTVSLLDDELRFTALSYVWGSPTATNTILLNGIRRQVTKNPAAAMKRLTSMARAFRRARNVFLLWADAVCINQDDNSEKSHQVSLMDDLCTSATSVYSWFGTESCIPTAIKTLEIVYRELQENEEKGHMAENLIWLRQHPVLYVEDSPRDEQTLIPNRHWTALQDFADLPYWSRMWIFQETVLSRPNQLVFMGSAGARISGDKLERAPG